MLLKREMLALPMDVSDTCPGTNLNNYILHKVELDATEFSEQNEVLT